jgi:oxygen-independent coproporphyrinogen-3 oxidase
MCDFELNMNKIEKQFKIHFKEYFKWGLNGLTEMINDGLVTIEGSVIKVNDMGRLLIRNIAMNFDGYIERQEDKMKYSRTV